MLVRIRTRELLDCFRTSQCVREVRVIVLLSWIFPAKRDLLVTLVLVDQLVIVVRYELGHQPSDVYQLLPDNAHLLW